MTRAPAPAHVLVVDDEPAIRALLSDVLADLGYLVETAVHGADALEKLARQSFQAILLDMMMPVMDGREFLGRLRQAPAAASPPVLVLSAAPADLLRSMRDLGAAACLEKPFEIDTLLDALSTVLAPPTAPAD
jgi:CheY-like chemotaxis protein